MFRIQSIPVQDSGQSCLGFGGMLCRIRNSVQDSEQFHGFKIHSHPVQDLDQPFQDLEQFRSNF